MGGGEKDTEKAHKVRSQKGHCTAGISTVVWYGRQAGGYRQDVGFLGNNKVWNPPGVLKNGLHDMNVQDGLNS